MEDPIKPADFLYYRPETRSEAIDLLGSFGDEAKVLAGGQSLMPMLNMRLVTPGHLIDINRIEDFPPLEVADGALRMGACVRQRDVEAAPATRSSVPILAEGLRFVGHRAVRDRGTVVGSITHADPASELPAVLLLLGGAVVAEGPLGPRSIPATDLFRGVFETAVRSDELVSSASFPKLEPDTGWAFDEIARRQGDFALCGAAAVVGSTWARLVLFGIGATPRLFDISGVVSGTVAIEECLSDLEPLGDIHASADYRKHLAIVLGKRVVKRAQARITSRREASRDD
jgi:carbon-monoxide dehydrogenase medium subunit